MKLGDMTKEEARKELVTLLYKAAPALADYAAEQWKVLKQEPQPNGKMLVTASNRRHVAS